MNTPAQIQDNSPIELTAIGLAELQAELKELEEVKLPEAIERVSIARDHGDLSENAEYHSARDDKELIETRISQIQDILDNSTVVKSTRSHQNVGMGSSVTVQKKGQKKTQTFQIVGEFEADPSNGKISSASPLGKALLKRKKGDSVKVVTPAGEVEYTIIKVA